MNPNDIYLQLEGAKNYFEKGAQRTLHADAQRQEISQRIGSSLRQFEVLQAVLGPIKDDIAMLCQAPDAILPSYKNGANKLQGVSEGTDNPYLQTAQSAANLLVQAVEDPNGSLRENLERMRRGSETVEQALGLLAAGLAELNEISYGVFLDFTRIAAAPPDGPDTVRLNAAQRIQQAITDYQAEL